MTGSLDTGLILCLFVVQPSHFIQRNITCHLHSFLKGLFVVGGTVISLLYVKMLLRTPTFEPNILRKDSL